jgi:membrane fusion protein, macrolide-specific efflux system
MSRKKRILAINGVLVLVLVLTGAGWGAYQLLWPTEESNAAAGVRTTAVTRTSVVETVSAAATVQSAYTANVDFGTGGTVSEINVKVGDSVAAGQQLAKLDAAEANQQLKVAQSNVEVAEEDLDEAETATVPPGGTAQSTTSLEAKLEQAKLSLQQAKDAVAATVLKAPGAGTVTAINGSVGQRLASGAGGSTSTQSSSFVVLTDLANLTVKANVAEIDASKLKAEQQATVTVNALPDTTIPAKVSSVDLTPTTTNNVVSFGAYLVLTQPQPGLRPGQSASVTITVARADDVLAVPSAAVRGTGAQSTVTVLSGGQQESRTVEVGLRSESLVQINSGLAQGEQVVLSAGSTTAPAGGGGGRFGGGGGGLGGGGLGQIPGGAVVPGGGR